MRGGSGGDKRVESGVANTVSATHCRDNNNGSFKLMYLYVVALFNLT